MRKVRFLVLSIGLVPFALLASEPKVAGADYHEALVIDIEALVATTPARVDCGKEDANNCASQQHEITKEEGGGDYQTHPCQPPGIHGGPKGCGSPVLLDLFKMSPEALYKTVAENPQVRLNHQTQRIEVLDCALDHVSSSAPFSLLGLEMR